MYDMERCAHCGRWVPRGTYICPFCGQRVSGWDKPRTLMENWLEEQRRYQKSSMGEGIGCLGYLVILFIVLVLIMIAC